LLIAPDPYASVHITVPAERSLKANVYTAWLRKIMRYADPLKRAAFAARRVELGIEGDLDWDEYIAPRPRYGEPEAVELVKAAVPQVEVKAVEPERDDEQVSIRVAAYLVRQQPWLAHRSPAEGGGIRYSSKAVLERRWSDGRVDYKCSRCDYTNENPKSVAVHYGRSKDHPAVGEDEGLVKDAQYTSPLSTREVARVARWQHRLERAMSGLDRESDDFVQRLAEKLVEQTEYTPATEREPLTAEQVVERIRRIVDSGEYVAAQERTAELELELEAVRGEIAAFRAEAAAADARATEYQERWDALYAIMQGESS
jgi:hypothetical protein